MDWNDNEAVVRGRWPDAQAGGVDGNIRVWARAHNNLFYLTGHRRYRIIKEAWSAARQHPTVVAWERENRLAEKMANWEPFNASGTMCPPDPETVDAFLEFHPLPPAPPVERAATKQVQAEWCEWCGPRCLGGACHNERAENGDYYGIFPGEAVKPDSQPATAGAKPADDLEELERLARKATSGPWFHKPDVAMNHWIYSDAVTSGAIAFGNTVNENAVADSIYIAACSPERIQALIRRVREAEILHRSWESTCNLVRKAADLKVAALRAEMAGVREKAIEHRHLCSMSQGSSDPKERSATVDCACGERFHCDGENSIQAAWGRWAEHRLDAILALINR